MQGAFDREDTSTQNMASVGGEIGEIEELLMMMRDTRDDLLQQKKMENSLAKSVMRRKSASEIRS